MKSEPEVFSIEKLQRIHRTAWDGVRNYQARNYMRDQMRVGDEILFYHSNSKPAGVAGLATVASEAYPDPTQFDAESEYYDAKATLDCPRWFLVDIAFLERFPRLVALHELKAEPRLGEMLAVKRGMRLSVQPVERAHFDRVVTMARAGEGSPSSR